MRFQALLLAVFPILAGTPSAFQSEAAVSVQRSVPSTDDGLTLAEVIQSLPLDPASIATVLLLLAFIGGVVWFGTRSGPDDSSRRDAPGPR